MPGAFDRWSASAAQVVFEMEGREAVGVRRYEKDSWRMLVAGVGLCRLTSAPSNPHGNPDTVRAALISDQANGQLRQCEVACFPH